MKLYGYWRSTSSWRVRLALHLKGVDFEYQPVHLARGEQWGEAYASINPRNEVPVLEVEEQGGIQRLAQSLAIIEYLEERYPTPALLPAEPLARARVRQLTEMVNAGIQPLQNLVVLNYVRDHLNGDEKAWTRHWIIRGLTALERVAEGTARRYLVGDAVTCADVYLVPQLYAARRFGVVLEALPTLLRVEAACSVLPAFERAHAHSQIDADPRPA
jgi:maleylpyruvate isomerase